MKYLYVIAIWIMFFMYSPSGVFAYEIKVSPDVSVGEGYVSNENLYIASLHAWFNSTFQKDLVSASYDQSVGGTFYGDLILLGKKIYLNGETFDDVRTIADTVTVNGVINKDLVIVARVVNIEPSAVINGDTLIMAHTVNAQGRFLGNNQITASKILINGSIAGPTSLTGSKIVFGPSSKVTSDLSYFSPQKSVVEPGADIQKQLNFNQIQSIKQNEVVKRVFFGFVSFWAIIKLIATLFVIFILTHLFRLFSQKIIDRVQERGVKIFFIGVASVFLIPLLILILFGSLILIPVSIIIAAIFVIMIILMPAVSSIIGASFYQYYVQKEKRPLVDFKISALMLLFLTFVGFVPYIGGVIGYILYFMSLGGMVIYLYEQIRRKKINF